MKNRELQQSRQIVAEENVMSGNFGVNVPPSENKPSVPSITEEEARLIWNTVRKPADAMLLKLLLGCGLRISEASALTTASLQREGME